MASYKVVLKPSIEKDLRSIPKSTVGRVMNQIERLSQDPFPRQTLKLEALMIFVELEWENTE